VATAMVDVKQGGGCCDENHRVEGGGFGFGYEA
jgi:hypothetical protein